MKLLSEKLTSLNIFPARTFGATNDQNTTKRLGQWSTRLYIIFLVITLSILALHTMFKPQTLTKSFPTSSLNVYNDLMHDHGDALQCPCSLISSSYSRYIQIVPIYHQICSSLFVSNEWRMSIIANLLPDLSVYTIKDYRRFISAHLQFLKGLCELSIQSVDQSIHQALSSLLITNQLLSN
ncbi:unnamed protein product [Adineta ricciae]|uniref:Uncharacterized protein n=1 Tax=Adineta ricciae TaxID=249248 RepID=A0A815R7X5_ADIRI|nr:unnamed protein product [Adineta ricciae]CAF1569037.1 unnamed protein product [Adineta ricciae]